MGKIQILHVPGVVVANTDIDLPATYPKMAAIIGAKILSLTEAGPNTYAVADLTVVAPDTLSTGQIAMVDEDTLKLGDATTASDKIELVITPKNTHHIPS